MQKIKDLKEKMCKKGERKFKPRELMDNVKSEPSSNKACIAGLGVVMGAVSLAYNALFFDVMRRSAQHQERALAG